MMTSGAAPMMTPTLAGSAIRGAWIISVLHPASPMAASAASHAHSPPAGRGSGFCCSRAPAARRNPAATERAARPPRTGEPTSKLGAAAAPRAALRLAARRLRPLAATAPHPLPVVTFPSAGEPLLAPPLPAMTAAAGDPVEITVIESEPDEALRAVRDGRADLALVYHFHTAAPPRGWPAAAGPGTYVPLVADPLRLLVPAGHPLAGRPAASLAEVAGERWIQGWGDVGDVADMLAALSGFRLQVACRSSDYRFMSALVGVGVGVALVPSPGPTGS